MATGGVARLTVFESLDDPRDEGGGDWSGYRLAAVAPVIDLDI